MGDVTAQGTTAVSEKSGHQVTPMGPNTCLTPAAPSPLPIPYPIIGTSSSLDVKCDHTKIDGKSVHSSFCKTKKVNGNQPGSALTKDITVPGKNQGTTWSLPVPAVTVFFEGKPQSTTGSPGFGNSN